MPVASTTGFHSPPAPLGYTSFLCGNPASGYVSRFRRLPAMRPSAESRRKTISHSKPSATRTSLPDGKQVAYVLTTVDQQANRRDTSIWVVAIDGHRLAAASHGRRRQFELAALESGWIARWRSSPAGTPAPRMRPPKLPRPQICILRMDGGEAQVAHASEERRRARFSGRRTASASWRSAAPARATTWPPAARKSDVRHYTHISYKFNDTGWYDDKRSHLWVVDAASGDGQADHLRRRLERYRSAMVARFHAHRLRLRPHRPGIRRRPQQGRLGDSGRRRTAHQNLRSRIRRRPCRAGRRTASRLSSPARPRAAQFPKLYIALAGGRRQIARWPRKISI